MINSGRSGDTTFAAVERFRRDVVAHKPHLVSVQFGINDCFGAVYRSEFRENVQWLILRLFEETSAEVVLVTSMLPRSENDRESLMRYYDVIIDYSKEYGLPLIRLDQLWMRSLNGERDFDEIVLPDGIHPSEEGYALIAAEFMKLFS